MREYSIYREEVTPEEFYFGQVIAQSYDLGHIVGWPGEEMAKEAFYLLVQEPNTGIIQYRQLPWQADGKMMLFQCVRKVLGKDTKNYPQQVGDCVSFGAKNAIEHLICVQQVLGVAPSKFRPIFPPYLYGCGRVFIGKGRIRPNEDGSVGSWQAQAVQKYGAIAADEQDVPPYSGKVAKQWGGQGPPKELVEIGKHYPVKSAAQMNSWQDMVGAVTNGYPCTIASNQGFTMEAGQDGFHSPKGKWGHQMSVIGVDAKYRSPYGIILNSWGDVHGHLKDFDTGEDLPIGCLRVHAEVIEGMIHQGDTFAYSHMDWFEEQAGIPEALFKLI
jgi:hypothetical protein